MEHLSVLTLSSCKIFYAYWSDGEIEKLICRNGKVVYYKSIN